MSRILVTGAGGFVGGHVARALAADGHMVVGTWRTRHPHLETVSWQQVSDVVEVEWAPLLDGVDAVVHAAGMAHVPERSIDPAAMFRTNAVAVDRLAAAAAAAGVGRVALVSSVAAMGDTSATPLDESTPCRPTGAYGSSKLEGERVLAARLAGAATDWVVVRPPLVYGRDAPGNLARLARLVSRGLPLPFGSVSNRRSFVAVANLADSIRVALDAPSASRRVFLVADDEVVSTPDLIRLIAAAMGRPVRMVAVPLPLVRGFGRIGDMAAGLLGKAVPVDTSVVDRLLGSLELDTTAFRSTVGWTPPVSLDAAIHEAFRPQVRPAGAET